jgi:YD repeat-containing protein
MKFLFSKQVFAIAALSSMVVMSCSKNDSTPGPGSTPSKKLVKIEEDDNSTTTFSYNNDGTFQKITTADADGDGNTMTFAYTGSKLSTITNADGSKISYTYQGDKISKADILDDANNHVSYNEFTYQDGKVSSVTMYANVAEEGDPEFIEYMKTIFTYYGNGDTKDMSISIINPLTNEMELAEKRTYEQYDTKTNPLAQLGEFSRVFLMDMSARNPLVEKSFNGDGILTETVTHEYTYDAAGYPLQVKSTTTPSTGSATVATLKYFYN